MFEKTCDKFLWSTIMDHNPTLKPTLIFCSSRKGAEAAAKALQQDCTYRPPGFVGVKLKQLAAQLGQTLGQLVSRGLAFHHAGYVVFVTLLVYHH